MSQMPSDAALPPGYRLVPTDQDQLMLYGGASWFAQGDVVSELEAPELAWYDWIRHQAALPDPVPAAAVFWIFMRYYDAVITPESPALMVADVADQAVIAAGNAIHADLDTMQAWMSGTAVMPWTAAQLLQVITRDAAD